MATQDIDIFKPDALDRGVAAYEETPLAAQILAGFTPAGLAADVASTAKYGRDAIRNLIARQYGDAATPAILASLSVVGLIPFAGDIAKKFGSKAVRDLDMSASARMGRAKDMGYDTDTILYHATNKFQGPKKSEFDTLIPSTKGKLGPGVYASKSPDYSERYIRTVYQSGTSQPLFGEGSRALPIFARGKIGNIEDYGRASDKAKDLLKKEFNAIDAVRKNNEFDELMANRQKLALKKKKAQEILSKEGFSGFEVSDEIVIFDPKNIRSVNAEFNPNEIKSAGLLKAKGGPVNKIQDDGALQGIKDFFLEQMKRSGERTAQMAEAQTKLPTPSAGQVANIAAMYAPGAGIYDAKQGWSALPSGKQPLSEAFSGEKSHTFDENLARGGIKGYVSAFLQGLGVVGDGAWGIPLAGAVVGPTVGTMLKTPVVIAKAAKAALKAIKTSAADKGIKLSIYEKDGVIDLSKIVVPEKGQGAGSETMRQIISYADETGQKIKLTPSTDFGASSVGRLKKFYKKFGFVENKGRNKTFEFRDSMYRLPKEDMATKAARTATLRAAANALRFGDEADQGIGSLDVDTSYRISHQPSPRDPEAIQLDNLSKDISGNQSGYPDDFYSSKGQRIYAQGPRFADDEYGIANEQSYKAIMEAKGNPEAKVTIYRAVPKGVGAINQGDFVTLSPKYAELHASSGYGGYGRGGDEAGEVISQKVKVKDVLWAGDDVNEFGYFPAPVDEIDQGIGALSRSDEGKGIATLTAQRAGKDIDQGIGALPKLDAGALDILEEINLSGGVQIDDMGNLTLYHRTTPAAASKIKETGVMTGKEDRLFFSTKPDGEISGYGSEAVEVKVPINKLQLDDIFENEVHLTLKTDFKPTNVNVISEIDAKKHAEGKGIASLEVPTPPRLGAEALLATAPQAPQQLIDVGGKPLARFFTEPEIAKLKNTKSAASFMALTKALPEAREMATVAEAGVAKRGWYQVSAHALQNVFGQDAPRFAGVLAATSPQSSVQSNLLNSSNIFKNWNAAGKPSDPRLFGLINEPGVAGALMMKKPSGGKMVKIPETEARSIFKAAGGDDGLFDLGRMQLQILGESVQGSKGINSILDAWVGNTLRVLNVSDNQIPDLVLSGPKVDSFMRNLVGNTVEVTNDTWIANYLGIPQTAFSGSLNPSRIDPGKGPGYIAANVLTRKAADILSDRLGEKVTGPEVQEMVWSWAKAVFERSRSEGMSPVNFIKEGRLTDAMINDTPDFSRLLNDPDLPYRNILKDDFNIGAPLPGKAPEGNFTQEIMSRNKTLAQDLRRAANRLKRIKGDQAALVALTPLIALSMTQQAKEDQNPEGMFSGGPVAAKKHADGGGVNSVGIGRLTRAA